MIEAALLALVVIFVAEFADKSQLVAFGFATRYGAAKVIGVLAVANALTQALSAGLGAAAGELLPGELATVLAGVVMLGFAVWIWRSDMPSPDDEAATVRDGAGSLIAMVGAVALAELGDKTMFATIALAAAEHPVGVWIGATVGMTAAGAVAVLGGRLLATRLTGSTVRWVTIAAFTLTGLVLVMQPLISD